MLARSAKTPPAGNRWAFELKLDGVRALVDTHDGLRVGLHERQVDRLPSARRVGM